MSEADVGTTKLHDLIRAGMSEVAHPYELEKLLRTCPRSKGSEQQPLPRHKLIADDLKGIVTVFLADGVPSAGRPQFVRRAIGYFV